MHFTPTLVCAAALCGTALVAPAMQVAPAAPPSKPAAPAAPSTAPQARPAAPTAPALPPPPEMPTEMPVLPKIFETQVVSAPSPTLSILFGQRVGAANGQFLVTGPVRAATAGRFGQLANFVMKDGLWAANPMMADVADMAPRDFAFQRIAAAGQVVATCIERMGAAASTVAVLEPDGSNWTQRAVLAAPSSIERPGFGSAIATDGTTIAVASVDLRFTEKKTLAIQNPEVFLYERKDAAWALAGKAMVPPDPSRARISFWFGSALSMDAGVLAVGSPASIPPRNHESTPSSGESFVFVFRKTPEGWVADGEIKGADVTKFTGFGSQVAIEGDLLAVRGLDIQNERTEAKVWLYRRVDGAWKMVNELVPAKGLYASRMYGARMVVSKGRVILSENTSLAADNGPERSLGMVLVFEERDGTWVNTMRLQPRDPCMPGQFGQDIAAMWPWVAVGRVKNEREGIPLGGAFLYKLGP